MVRGLNAGTRETANLAEALSVDFAKLMEAGVPEAGADAVRAMRAVSGEGVVKRMEAAGEALAGLGLRACVRLSRHQSDTVRGWACYAIGRAKATGRSAWTIGERMERVRPLAADPHFGVREWAWIAVRPFIVEDPMGAIGALAPWTADEDENVRRFASEATRPRGVWCAHIQSLKADPAPGLAVLEPLRADPTKYVQDSVANWLNDASKTAPDWVRGVCARWGGGEPATARIVRRALRSIGEA